MQWSQFFRFEAFNLPLLFSVEPLGKMVQRGGHLPRKLLLLLMLTLLQWNLAAYQEYTKEDEDEIEEFKILFRYIYDHGMAEGQPSKFEI